MNSFVEAATKQVEYQAVGGAKRTAKKAVQSSKQDGKKTQQKQAQKSQEKKTQQKQQERSSQDKKKQSAKKGGAIVDDVKNLAVPFAILLAKEGLSKMFPKGAKTTKSSLSPASASKSSSSRRRTMSGGSCNLGCTAQTGGQAAKQLFELQTEIDRFLEKY
jgi:hypothetical protein